MGNLKHIAILPWMILGVVVAVNFFYWLHSRTILPAWGNVPPALSVTAAKLSSLNDPEIAYRGIGYFLQSVGNTGGRYESLQNYNYAALEDWFTMAHELNPRADLIPFLAAFFFGALDGYPEKIAHVTDFLAMAGQTDYPEKWRWLAHAVFLARHKEKDLDKALALSEILAGLDQDVAPWGRQMPAFVQMGIGNRRAAYEIMVRILVTEGEKLHPNEVNYMKDFICTRALEPAEAAKNPLCAADGWD